MLFITFCSTLRSFYFYLLSEFYWMILLQQCDIGVLHLFLNFHTTVFIRIRYFVRPFAIQCLGFSSCLLWVRFTMNAFEQFRSPFFLLLEEYLRFNFIVKHFREHIKGNERK